MGHRSVDMMMRLATRSVYWTGMKKDLTDYFNECEECNHNMRKNKTLPDLPEDETTLPYECISIDIFETYAKEHALAMIDRHTGYVWCRKTGNKNTGTAKEILYILKEVLGAPIFWVKRFKTDHGSNIVGGAIEEFSKTLGIWQDKSSAYHAPGNKCVENAVGRIKRAIGKNKIEDAIDDINALNISSPYNNKTLAAVEDMYARTSQVNGIPRPDHLDKELISRELVSERKTRAEHTGSNPHARSFTSKDQHEPTQEENDLSADWVEKINGEVSTSKDELTCGDRVYYIDHQRAVKGPGRWRTGVIIKRKKDYKYSTGVYEAHGYDIYDVENCTTVTRTRADIRKYKHTKIERELLEIAHKHLQAMREEFMKNDRFHNNGLDAPVEFDMSDYDTAKKNSPYLSEQQFSENEIIPPGMEVSRPHLDQKIKQEPAPEDQDTPKQEPISKDLEEPKASATPKLSNEAKKLKDNLNGPYWTCKESHGRRSLRVKTIKENDETAFKGTWDNVITMDAINTPEED